MTNLHNAAAVSAVAGPIEANLMDTLYNSLDLSGFPDNVFRQCLSIPTSQPRAK